MYERILIPLDGSGRAEAILPHAEYLAQMDGAAIILLRVVEPAPIIAGPYDARPLTLAPEDAEARLREIDAYLAGLVERLAAKGIEARHLIVQGPVVETIIEVATGENADLIALASHGRSGLTRVFYGSVAAGILQRIDRPLLLVRAQKENST